MNLARLGHPLAQGGQEKSQNLHRIRNKRALISYDKMEDESTIEGVRRYANANDGFSSTNPQKGAFNNDHAEKIGEFKQIFKVKTRSRVNT